MLKNINVIIGVICLLFVVIMMLFNRWSSATSVLMVVGFANVVIGYLKVQKMKKR